MKRFLGVWVALLLALSPLAGLAGEAAEDLLMYQERTVALPEGYGAITAMCVAPDGALVALAANEAGEWALLVWQDPAGSPEVRPLAYEGGDVAVMSVAPDGWVMVITRNMEGLMTNFSIDRAGDGREETQAEAETSGEESQAADRAQQGTRTNQGFSMGGMDGVTSTVLWFNPEGALENSFDIQGYTSNAAALAGQSAAVAGMQSGVTVYGADGQEERRFDAMQVSALAATEASLYIADYESVTEMDLATGEKVRVAPINTDYSPSVSALPDGTLLLAGAGGVYRLSPGAAEAVRIMNPTGTYLGDPVNSLNAFAARPDGTLFALLSEGGMGGMARGISVSFFGEPQAQILAYYTPLDPGSVGVREPFAITALYTSNRLNKAVSDFQRLHPELAVNLQVQLEDGDDTTLEDHIRTLNTDLLAGKGGDVLILDGLPADRYAARGILLDLTDLVPELGLLPGIAAGSADVNGRVYAVPVQFTFQSLWGNGQAIDSARSLEDLPYLGDASGKTPFMARTAEDWVRLFYPACESAFRDGEGRLRFDTPAFEAFLETLYTLYSEQGEMPTDLFPMMGRATGARGGARGNMMSEMLSVYNGAAAFFPLEITGLMTIDMAYSVTGAGESGFMALPSLYGEGRTYTPSTIAGVNAQSGKQELALEFLRLLFSPEVQEMDQMSSLPAAAASLDKLFSDRMEQESDTFAVAGIAGGVTVELSSPDPATWQALRALCDGLDTPYVDDDTLMDFIITETADFFEGYGSAADAAYAVQQRAWYYLNE